MSWTISPKKANHHPTVANSRDGVAPTWFLVKSFSPLYVSGFHKGRKGIPYKERPVLLISKVHGPV